MSNNLSKILFWTMMIFVFLTVSASYYRFIVTHDYIIEAEVDCDPTIESCFVWECDPAIEGECTGNIDDDLWYYKFAYRNAKYIPECFDDSCDSFKCSSKDEPGCSEVTCDEVSRLDYGISKSCVKQVY